MINTEENLEKKGDNNERSKTYVLNRDKKGRARSTTAAKICLAVRQQVNIGF